MAWTAPRTWVAAETVTASLMNTHVRDNLKAIGDAWTSYTPTWTATGTAPAIGNGTAVGSYVAAGKLIHFKFLVTFGSTSTFGTGSYRFALPVTAATVTFTTQAVHSSGYILDSSASSSLHTFARMVTTSTMEVLSPTSTANVALAVVGQTVPWTWAQSDTISVAGTYEAA